MPYIYKIVNDVNDKIYIGKTSLTIEERFKEHLHDSADIRREKRPLYDAINKYGSEHFSIILIEEVENDEIASERETYWIEKLRTYVGFDDCKGYNATLGGDGKRFYDYDLLAEEYLKLGTLKAVAKKYNCDEQPIRNACREKGIYIETAPNKIGVIQKTKDGEILNIFSSISEAARDYCNINSNVSFETARKNISRAVNRGGTAYSYYYENNN